MHFTSESVEALVEQFTKLPTIGRKTAQRLAAFVLKMPRDDVVEIAKALVAVKDKVRHCSICCNVTDEDPCPICRSSRRDHTTICVVEEPSDVMALERTNEYRGVYHVLGGVISPLDGIGPEDLNIRELVARIDPAFEDVSSQGEIKRAAEPEVAYEESEEQSEAVQEAPKAEKSSVEEVILAVNPNVEGDTTAYYISQLLEPLGVHISRIARGLPIGGDLEYADEATLSRAIEGRSAL